MSKGGEANKGTRSYSKWPIVLVFEVLASSAIASTSFHISASFLNSLNSAEIGD
jgi:hypothetical protein